jgi:hypothetical protein
MRERRRCVGAVADQRRSGAAHKPIDLWKKEKIQAEGGCISGREAQ